MAELFYTLRKHKGVTREEAKEKDLNPVEKWVERVEESAKEYWDTIRKDIFRQEISQWLEDHEREGDRTSRIEAAESLADNKELIEVLKKKILEFEENIKLGKIHTRKDLGF